MGKRMGSHEPSYDHRLRIQGLVRSLFVRTWFVCTFTFPLGEKRTPCELMSCANPDISLFLSARRVCWATSWISLTVQVVKVQALLPVSLHVVAGVLVPHPSRKNNQKRPIGRMNFFIEI